MFAAAGIGESVFQSVQIVNTSDTPVYFKVLQDPSHTFKVFPPTGLIHGKSFAILCF